MEGWGAANAIPQLFTQFKWQPLQGVHDVCLNERFVYLRFVLFHLAEMEMLLTSEMSKDKSVPNVSRNAYAFAIFALLWYLFFFLIV